MWNRKAIINHRYTVKVFTPQLIVKTSSVLSPLSGLRESFRRAAWPESGDNGCFWLQGPAAPGPARFPVWAALVSPHSKPAGIHAVWQLSQVFLSPVEMHSCFSYKKRALFGVPHQEHSSGAHSVLLRLWVSQGTARKGTLRTPLTLDLWVAIADICLSLLLTPVSHNLP